LRQVGHPGEDELGQIAVYDGEIALYCGQRNKRRAMANLFSCSNCGHIVAANARFCIGCGTPGPIARHPNSWRTSEPPEAIADLLSAERATQPVAVPPRSLPPSRVEAVSVEVMPPVNRPVVVIANQKSSGLAVLLSFFWCGLGQLYNGQILKGLGLMVVYPIFAWIGLISSFVGLFGGIEASTPDEQAAAGGFGVVGVIALLFAVAIWLYGMINAYRTAEAINRRQIQTF
jgi:TM2 domain-containing membrane protein YozV